MRKIIRQSLEDLADDIEASGQSVAELNRGADTRTAAAHSATERGADAVRRLAVIVRKEFREAVSKG